ncbi:MAG: hypothetical protein ABSD71_03510 [Bacteroidales bacterium]|jgi:hypothetical protein
MRNKSQSICNVLPINQYFLFWAYLLFFGIFLSWSTGCTKTKNIPTNYIPQDLKDCLVFKSGSYWVYLNESNETIDSNYVIGEPVYSDILAGFGETDSYSQQCKTIYNGSFIDSVIIIQKNYSIYLNTFLFSGSESTTFIPGQISYIGTKDTLRGLALLDTMTINKKLFQNIYVTQYSSVTTNGKPYVCTAYFVRNLGLIRFDYHYNGNTTRWILLKYKAVQ